MTVPTSELGRTLTPKDIGVAISVLAGVTIPSCSNAVSAQAEALSIQQNLEPASVQSSTPEAPIPSATPEAASGILTESIANEAAKSVKSFALDGVTYEGTPEFVAFPSGELAVVNAYNGLTQIEGKQVTIGTMDLTGGNPDVSTNVLVEYNAKTQESTASLLLLHNIEQQGDTTLVTYTIAAPKEGSQTLEITNRELVLTTPKEGNSTVIIKNADGSVETLGTQGTPTVEPTMPSEMSLVVFRTSKRQLLATPTAPVEVPQLPTDIPVVVPAPESVESDSETAIPCETKLANWREYPLVTDLIPKIKSGEIAKLLHEQQVFEKLMKEKGIEHPFNSKALLKNVSARREEYIVRWGFLPGSAESQKALKNPEASNVWVVCGFKTQEQGHDMMVFAVAYPSSKSQDGYVYSFLAYTGVNENGDPQKYTKRLDVELQELDINGGQAFPVVLLKDPRNATGWENQKNDVSVGWYPDLAEIIGQPFGKDTEIESLTKTGRGSDTLENEIRIGKILPWTKVNYNY